MLFGENSTRFFGLFRRSVDVGCPALPAFSSAALLRSHRRGLPSHDERFLATRPPRPSSFCAPARQPSHPTPPLVQFESHNLTQLAFDAPDHLKKQAYEMYAQCKLSDRDPPTRFAIARQMRNLDLPPHGQLWQSINAADELRLYRWIDEAFGQLLYLKGLWIPCAAWGAEDDQTEASERAKNLELLHQAYENQIVRRLRDTFGHAEVTVALSNLSKDQQLYCEPAIIWRSTDPRSGQVSLEWMSEFTADVIWPGLVSCRAPFQIARRHWEQEARQFAHFNGGIARGLGAAGEALPLESEDEKRSRCQVMNTKSSDDQGFPGVGQTTFQSSQARHIAEQVLIKQFIAEREGTQDVVKKPSTGPY